MDQIQSSYAAARQNPVKTGIFAVLGVVAIGALAGFVLGYDAPAKTWAIAPVTVVAPVAPVVTVPIVTVPVVTTPIVTPVTVTAPTAPANDNPAPSPSSETPTVTGVTVTAPVSNDDSTTDPCCTNNPTTPTTPVTPSNDSTTNPCCTNTPTTPTPVTPTVVIVPPFVPPVVPPAPEFCPNRPDLDKNNLPAGYYVDGSGNCVTRTVTDVKQCVFLKGNNLGGGIPVVINRNQPFNLEWKTEGVPSVTISNVDGTLPANGSKVVYPTQNTTYVLTAPGISTPCQVNVVITDIEQGPQCLSLTANKSTIKKGETVTLNWVISNASRINISNVGTKDGLTGSVEVTPTENTVYRGTVDGAPDNGKCVAEVKIEDEPGCTSNCGGGGGGGGGRRSPRVVLDSVTDFEEPLSFVYLSEVPYTGLELGTWGTVLYWMMLIGWSLALAYLVLFNAVPFALARAKTFGSNVKDAMNSDASHGHDTHTAAVAHAVSHAPSGHGHADAHAQAAPSTPTGYSAHDGFRSFAAGEGLTIDDIVKGLSREIEQKQQETHAAPTHEEVMQAVYEAPTPAPEYVPTPAAPVYQAPKPAAVDAAAPMNGDVRDFVAALLNGDRDTVFGMIRSMARQGHDTEAFVSNAACALDDAYRACIDGTTCHPDIAELTNGCHPSYLERLVASLTTAVDGSYSAGMTGVKMALTRALGVVAG